MLFGSLCLVQTTENICFVFFGVVSAFFVYLWLESLGDSLTLNILLHSCDFLLYSLLVSLLLLKKIIKIPHSPDFWLWLFFNYTKLCLLIYIGGVI